MLILIGYAVYHLEGRERREVNVALIRSGVKTESVILVLKFSLS